MGMLLNTLNPDDIRGGDKQPGETEEQYQMRVAEENKILAKLENERFVCKRTSSRVPKHANNCISRL